MVNSYNRTPDDNADVRVFWLGEVSAAATALAGTKVPRELSDSEGVTKSSGPVISAVRSTSLSIGRDDSFYPDIPLARSDLQCRSKLAVITLVVACLSLIASGEFTSTGTHHRLTSESSNSSFSSAISPEAVKATTVGERFSPRLIAQPSSGRSGEPVPLGLAVHGASEQAVVYVTDLVRGMELSTGKQVDSQTWEVPAAELSHAWIAPPDGFVGAINLIAELRLPDGTTADRQVLQFEWLLPMSQAPAIRPVQDAAVPILPRQTVQAEGDPETTAIGPRPVDRNGTTAPSSSLAAGQSHDAAVPILPRQTVQDEGDPETTATGRGPVDRNGTTARSSSLAAGQSNDAAVPIVPGQTVQAVGAETTAIPRPVDRNGATAVPSSSLAAGQSERAQAGNTPGAAQGNSWSVYRDNRGTRVEYPAGIFSVSTGRVDGGVSLARADGRAHVQMFSIPNPKALSPASYMRSQFPGDRSRLTYDRVARNFFAISIRQAGMIKYLRCNFSSNAGGTLHCVDLHYPADEKRAWDGIVTRMSLSLRPLPPAAEGHMTDPELSKVKVGWRIRRVTANPSSWRRARN
jgi:hypothetical protein